MVNISYKFHAPILIYLKIKHKTVCVKILERSLFLNFIAAVIYIVLLLRMAHSVKPFIPFQRNHFYNVKSAFSTFRYLFLLNERIFILLNNVFTDFENECNDARFYYLKI